MLVDKVYGSAKGLLRGEKAGWSGRWRQDIARMLMASLLGCRSPSKLYYGSHKTTLINVDTKVGKAGGKAREKPGGKCRRLPGNMLSRCFQITYVETSPKQQRRRQHFPKDAGSCSWLWFRFRIWFCHRRHCRRLGNNNSEQIINNTSTFPTAFSHAFTRLQYAAYA